MAYLTQAEAAVYVPAFADISAERAAAELEVASEMIDNACGRTFDTVLETLPYSIRKAVSILAYELAIGGADFGRDATSERIGDYAGTYSDKSSGSTDTSIPDSVMTLIAPYKALIVG